MDLAQARQRKTQNTGSYDPKRDADCDAAALSQGSPGQESRSSASPSSTNPEQPEPANSPNVDEDNLMHAQLSQPGQNMAGESSLQTVSFDVSNPLSFRNGRASPTAGSNASDGLLAAYGNETGMNVSAPAAPPEQPDTRPAPKKMRQPEMIRKLSPYASIPSLYDMNVQAVTHPTAPRRLRAEGCENGTPGSQSIDIDLAARP